MAFVENLELGLYVELDHLLQDTAHDWKAVFEDVVAEVHAAARERRHFGSKFEHAGPFERRHADRPARRKLNDEVASGANRFVGFAESLDGMRVAAVVVTAVHVNDGSARLPHGASSLAQEPRRVWQIRRLVGTDFGPDGRTG